MGKQWCYKQGMPVATLLPEWSDHYDDIMTPIRDSPIHSKTGVGGPEYDIFLIFQVCK